MKKLGDDHELHADQLNDQLNLENGDDDDVHSSFKSCSDISSTSIKSSRSEQHSVKACIGKVL